MIEKFLPNFLIPRSNYQSQLQSLGFISKLKQKQSSRGNPFPTLPIQGFNFGPTGGKEVRERFCAMVQNEVEEGNWDFNWEKIEKSWDAFIHNELPGIRDEIQNLMTDSGE